MMFDKVKYVIKNFLLFWKKRKGLKTEGLLPISIDTEVTIEASSICLHHGVGTASNVHLVALRGAELTIGRQTYMNRNTIIVSRNKIVIGQNCSIGPNVMIYDHNHKFDKDGVKQSEYSVGEVYIGDNCWIGAGAIILKGAHIGNGCVVGAGAIVKGIIPPHSIVTMERSTIFKPIEGRD